MPCLTSTIRYRRRSFGIANAVVMFIAGSDFALGAAAKSSHGWTCTEYTTAAVTLVALLMAFAFPIALGHFDARSGATLR
jgi:hypothetical protein